METLQESDYFLTSMQLGLQRCWESMWSVQLFPMRHICLTLIFVLNTLIFRDIALNTLILCKVEAGASILLVVHSKLFSFACINSFKIVTTCKISLKLQNRLNLKYMYQNMSCNHIEPGPLDFLGCGGRGWRNPLFSDSDSGSESK